jgi:hypothetical protein
MISERLGKLWKSYQDNPCADRDDNLHMKKLCQVSPFPGQDANHEETQPV